MKATLKLEDGREIQMELSDKDVDAIVKPKKTGWERAEVGEYYKYIHIGTDTEDEARADDDRYQEGRYISSRDLANDQTRAIKLWLRIKRWAAEHCEPEDWNDINEKYYIFHNHFKPELRVGSYSTTEYAFGVYFDTREHAKQCVEEFKDDLLWYFTKCRDRMDG